MMNCRIQPSVSGKNDKTLKFNFLHLPCRLDDEINPAPVTRTDYNTMSLRYEELQQWDEALSRYNEKLEQQLPDKSSYVLGKLRFVASKHIAE